MESNRRKDDRRQSLAAELAQAREEIARVRKLLDPDGRHVDLEDAARNVLQSMYAYRDLVEKYKRAGVMKPLST